MQEGGAERWVAPALRHTPFALTPLRVPAIMGKEHKELNAANTTAFVQARSAGVWECVRALSSMAPALAP